jgi:hypothetical protein
MKGSEITSQRQERPRRLWLSEYLARNSHVLDIESPNKNKAFDRFPDQKMIIMEVTAKRFEVQME